MWALLPLKNFNEAKQRLSGVLSPLERRGLFQAMVEDVLGVLHQHPHLEGTLLISDDPTARLLAELYQVDFLQESALCAEGLNGVVQAGVEHLAENGIDDVMVIHGDLPLITTAEVSHLINRHRQQKPPALTIAPDARLEGTNCLLCNPASVLSYCYGNQSLARHSLQSRQKALALQIEPLWGAGRDIDTPEDLDFYIRHAPSMNSRELISASRTSQFIVESGIGERIEVMFQQRETAEGQAAFEYPQAS